MKEKVCCVVQRYGLEVNGGAELHCRELAERLVPYYDVEVLTTKAIDYVTWKDEYKKTEEIINGVKVRRFSVAKERDSVEFNRINDIFMLGGLAREQEQDWMDAQGPYVPALIEYIREHKDNYKVFIFFTYLGSETLFTDIIINSNWVLTSYCIRLSDNTVQVTWNKAACLFTIMFITAV